MDGGETAEMPAAREPLVAAEHAPPPQSVEFRPTLHTAERRPLGLSAPAFSAGLLVGGLVLAVVLFAVGLPLGAVLALLVALGAALLFRAAVAREPESEAARLARRAAVETRSRSRLGFVSLRAFSAAWLEVLRLRAQRRRLQRDLHRCLSPLGEAVLHGDTVRAEVLRAQAEAAETRLREVEREIAIVLARARERVDQERSVAQPTQTLSVEDTDGQAGGAQASG